MGFAAVQSPPVIATPRVMAVRDLWDEVCSGYEIGTVTSGNTPVSVFLRSTGERVWGPGFLEDARRYIEVQAAQAVLAFVQSAETDLGSSLNCVMCCTCGNEEDCTWEDQRIGRPWQCSACGMITVAAISRGGRKVWVEVKPDSAEFVGLLKKPEEED